MDMPLFFVFLCALQGLYWFIGKKASTGINTQEDYYLAGRTVSFFPLMMTFLATQVGGGVILGAAEEAYIYGWPVFLYPLGASLGLILLGLGVGRKLAEFRVSTVAEIFEVAYGSRTMRKIASLLSVVSLFMVLVAQIIASSKFMISLGINSTPLFIAFWSVVIIYTVRGGLKAVISTDIAQASVFSGIFLFSIVVAASSQTNGGLPNLATLEEYLPVTSKLSGWLLMPLLFMVIEQDMAQRCFAGASPKIVSRAALCAGICTMTVCIVPVLLGCYAKIAQIPIPLGGSVLMEAVSAVTNPWWSSMVGCAVLAAILSTATALINAISSNLCNDFNLGSLQKRNPLALAKGMTALISAAGIGCAFYFDNIVGLLIQSYELSVYCLFVPIAALLIKRKGSAEAAWLAIVCGAMGFVLSRYYPLPMAQEVPPVLLSACGYFCGEWRGRYRASKRTSLPQEAI